MCVLLQYVCYPMRAETLRRLDPLYVEPYLLYVCKHEHKIQKVGAQVRQSPSAL